ncbi:MAG: hypothetical protein WBF48_06795 [Halarcobacter sp.]
MDNIDNNELRIIFNIQEEKKKKLNINITDFENFEKMYFIDSTRLHSIIESSNGYKISKLHTDIEYIIKRMDKVLLKIDELYKEFDKSHNNDLMDDFTELTYLFVSYSYSILMINNDELNVKYPINDFEKKRQKLFDNDGIHNIIIGVIRNSFHHGNLLHNKWLVKCNEKCCKLYITFNIEELYILKDRDDKLRLKRKGIDYIEECSGDIDISSLFSVYLENVKEFFFWYKLNRYKTFKDDMDLYNKYMNHKKIIEDKIKFNGIKKS